MTDLPLILEWVKALGTPLAALLAAGAAVFGFRYQRRLDRRLDWYAAVIQQFGDYSDAVERARRDPESAESRKAASDAADKVMGLTMIGFMYVGPRGQRAIEEWFSAVWPVILGPMSSEKAAILTEATATAVYEIAQEARQKLGLGKLLTKRHGITKRGTAK